MQRLTNKSKIISNKEMTLKEKIYLPAVLGGMKITFSHFFKKPVTTSYPEEKRDFSPVIEVVMSLKEMMKEENDAPRADYAH